MLCLLNYNEQNQKNINININYKIYLIYDVKKDYKTKNYLREQGQKIHNISSVYSNIFTYFDDTEKANWNNLIYECLLGIPDNIESIDYYYDEMMKLKQQFQIEYLPAIVVVKDGNFNNYCKSEFVGTRHPFRTNNIIKDIVELIQDYYNEDFNYFKAQFNQKLTFNFYKLNTSYSLNDIIDSIVCKERILGMTYTRIMLAEELAMTERSLRNKIENRSFTREECYFIALRFKLNLNELRLLLHHCALEDLGYDGPDEIIREGIENNSTIEEVNNNLREYNWSPLIEEKRNKKDKNLEEKLDKISQIKNNPYY